MSKKAKKAEFRLSFKVIFRILLFALVVYLLIGYFSQKRGQTLGVSVPEAAPYVNSLTQNIYTSLPPQSQKIIADFSALPLSKTISDKISYLQAQSQGFPQKQVKELQKTIIRMVADELVKRVDNN